MGDVRHVLIDGFPAVGMLAVEPANATTALIDEVVATDRVARGTLADGDRDNTTVPLSRCSGDGRASEGEGEGKGRDNLNHVSNRLNSALGISSPEQLVFLYLRIGYAFAGAELSVSNDQTLPSIPGGKSLLTNLGCKPSWYLVFHPRNEDCAQRPSTKRGGYLLGLRNCQVISFVTLVFSTTV